MAEYSSIDVGLTTTTGHTDSGATFTATNRPSLKPIFQSAIIETELAESMFFVVDLGEGELWEVGTGGSGNDSEDTTTNSCVATIWSKFGNDWLKFHVGTGLGKSTTSIVTITPNTPGSQVLGQDTLLLSGSLTPVIGSRTYLTIEPQITPLESSLVNGLPVNTGGTPDDAWDWIDGTTITAGDAGKFYGYQLINSIKAYVKNPD